MRQLVVIVVLCFAAAIATAGEPLVIVEDGRSDYEIVVAKGSLPTTRLAAIELRGYLRDSTHVKLPLVDRPTKGRHQIYITAATQLKPHGFAIQAAGRNLYLRGHDSGGADQSVDFHDPVHRGTCNAVYEFLERYVGVRWFWSDSLGEIVPRLARVTVPADVAIRQEPAFDYRAINNGPRGTLHGDWARHNRLGSQSTMHHSHALQKIVPVEEWAARGHPEFAALRGNKRRIKKGGHVCTGNPDVVRIVAATAIKFFTEHPRRDMFSLTPPDGSGLCTCGLCTRYDVPGYKLPDGPHKGQPVITDRMLEFYNTVATLVAREHPDRLLGAGIYMDYLYPPRRVRRVHPNLALIVSPNQALWLGDAGIRAMYDDLFSVWGGLHDRVYVHDIWYNMRRIQGLPAPSGERLVDMMRLVADSGFRGGYQYIGPSWECLGADGYLLARLFWDPYADAEKIRREYYGLLYQRASGPVRAYFDLAERCWQEAIAADAAVADRLAKAFHRTTGYARGYPGRLLLGYGSHVAEMEQLVIEAEGAAAGDALLERRVARLRDNFELTKVTLDGLRAVVDYELDTLKRREPMLRLAKAIMTRESFIKRISVGYGSTLAKALRSSDKRLNSPLVFGGYYYKLATAP